jgi:predicted kinase
MIRLRSDVERKRMAGLDAVTRCGKPAGEGLYLPQSSQLTYPHLALLAEGLLNAGWPVIIDAACLERWQRDIFRNLTRLEPPRCSGRSCHIAERIAKRASLYGCLGCRLEHSESSTRNDSPLDPDELSCTLIINS